MLLILFLVQFTALVLSAAQLEVALAPDYVLGAARSQQLPSATRDDERVLATGLIDDHTYVVYANEEDASSRPSDGGLAQAVIVRWCPRKSGDSCSETSVWATTDGRHSPAPRISAAAELDSRLALLIGTSHPRSPRTTLLTVGIDGVESEAEVTLPGIAMWEPRLVSGGGGGGAWLVFRDHQTIYVTRVSREGQIERAPVAISGSYSWEGGSKLGSPVDFFGLDAAAIDQDRLAVVWPSLVGNRVSLILREVAVVSREEYSLAPFVEIVMPSWSFATRPSLAVSDSGVLAISWVEIQNLRSSAGRAWVGVSNPQRTQLITTLELFPHQAGTIAASAIASGGNHFAVGWTEYAEDYGTVFSRMLDVDGSWLGATAIKGAPSTPSRYLDIACEEATDCLIWWEQKPLGSAPGAWLALTEVDSQTAQ